MFVKPESALKIICQENFKNFNFDVVITDTKRITLLKTASNTRVYKKKYVNLFNVEAFFVHELPALVFNRFSATLHYSVMTQMILAFLNTVQILNINL